MRKVLAVVVAAGLVATMIAAPASAGKKKKKKPRTEHGSFSATALPFPNLSSSTGTAKPGCSAGEEGVHWVGEDWAASFSGELTLHMEGFTGDWDMYIYDGDVPIARSDAAQVGEDLAPPVEEAVVPVKKGQELLLVICNWMGAPTAEAHWELVG